MDPGWKWLYWAERSEVLLIVLMQQEVKKPRSSGIKRSGLETWLYSS